MVTVWMNYKYTASYFQVSLSSNGITHFVSKFLQNATGVRRGREMSYERRKVRTGRVVSDKMDSTVVVQVEWHSPHRIYKKPVRRRSKLVVHDPENIAMVGDLVEVMESRPRSKTKRWRLVRVLQRSGVDLRPSDVEVETPNSPEQTPVTEPDVEVETLDSSEQTPVTEPDAEVETPDSPEQAPVTEPDVEVETLDSSEQAPVIEPDAEVETLDSSEQTPVTEADAEVETPDSSEQTPVTEPDAGIEALDSPEQTPVTEPDAEVETLDSPEQTPVTEPDAEVETLDSSDQAPATEPDAEVEMEPVDAEPVTREPEPPPSEPTPTGADEPTEPFAKNFFGAQTTTPRDPSARPVAFPLVGPATEQSAKDHTRQSGRVGQSEAHVTRIVARSELGPKGNTLSNEFREMVEGDYGKRCQICGRTFMTPNGEPHVFIVHIVAPRKDFRTNHFGDLLGLCGWHYALVQYGEWVIVQPETEEPVKDWKHMKDFLLNVSKKEDEADNTYYAVPIRFWNVYQGWGPEPVTNNEEIRYSEPHWIYLCELLKT